MPPQAGKDSLLVVSAKADKATTRAARRLKEQTIETEKLPRSFSDLIYEEKSSSRTFKFFKSRDAKSELSSLAATGFEGLRYLKLDNIHSVHSLIFESYFCMYSVF